MFNSTEVATAPYPVPLGFTPRYQIGYELPLLSFFRRAGIYWRTVSRYRFFEEVIARGMLSRTSDLEAATILYASGVVLKDGKRYFRVVKH